MIRAPLGTNEQRLKAAREIIDILESYHLSINDFSDSEYNHFIDLWFVADRGLAESIICEACLKRLTYGI